MLPGAADEAAEEEFPVSETDTVKVFVRARPINEREVQLGGLFHLPVDLLPCTHGIHLCNGAV